MNTFLTIKLIIINVWLQELRKLKVQEKNSNHFKIQGLNCK
jgi:hypothetical protein